MVVRAVPIAALFLLLAGCVEYADLADPRHPGTYGLHVSERASFLPSFPGEAGEVYPALLVHQHLEYPRSEDDPVVVCLNPGHGILSDAPIGTGEAAAADAALAPCEPLADPATGSLHVELAKFEAARPDAVVLNGGPYCYDAVDYRRAGDAWAQDHAGRAVEVALRDDGAFLIDGRVLSPGRALKIEYYHQRGDYPDRTRDPKVVLLYDYPGTWSKARIGPAAEGVPPLPPQPEPPLEVRLPRGAETLSELLAPLWVHGAWREAHYASLEVGWMKGEIFSVRAATHDGHSWLRADTAYTARDAIVVHLRSSPGPVSHSVRPLSLHAVAAAFDDLPLADLLERSGVDGDWARARIQADKGQRYDWMAELPHRVQNLDATTCQSGACVWVRAQEPLQGAEWRRVWQAEPSSHGYTLHVSGLRAGSLQEASFHPADLVDPND